MIGTSAALSSLAWWIAHSIPTSRAACVSSPQARTAFTSSSTLVGSGCSWAVAEVDSPANRVVVGKGSAYDLYLSRELKQAQILRSPSSQTVVDTFIEAGAEVAAGVKQQLEADALRVGGVRLLPGRFMVIQQAMGLPKGRGDAAAALLRRYVEDMKASGFVAQALQRHGIQGATVAPAQG